MHGFFYYVSGAQEPHPKRDALESWGLGYAFDAQVARRGCLRGPDGMAGVVVARPGSGDLGFYPDKQTWRQIPPRCLAEDAPPIFVGHDCRSLPTPEDLKRDNQLAGHVTELADGRKWLCPAAIAIDADDVSGAAPNWRSSLPMGSTLDDDGIWRRSELRREYAPLWEVAKAYWLAFHEAAGNADDSGVRFDFSGAHEAAVTCLAANYRVGPVECSLLGVLDETVIALVLQAAIDWPLYKQWLQKKSELAPAGSPSSVGPEV